MRILRTVLLAVLAVLLLTASVFLTVNGNLARLTGWYRFEKGELVFRDQEGSLDQVDWMRIADLHDTIECQRQSDGTWWIFKPFEDRLAPEAAGMILSFTAQARLVDTLPYTRELRNGLREFGVESSPVHITLKDHEHGGRDHTIARYTLGSTSPWLADLGDGKSVTPTTYLRTNFYGRDKRIHVVTGNILSLFREGLVKLRDHSPFRFDPNQVEEITLQLPKESALTVRRNGKQWVLTAPANASADAAAVEALLGQLGKLRASKVESRDAVKLTSVDDDDVFRISVRTQGTAAPVTLSIYPPVAGSEGAAPTCLATVSDRPVVLTLPAAPKVSRKGSYSRILGEAFRLPVLPKEAWSNLRSKNREISVAELKKTPDELRSRVFTNLDPADVAQILLRFKYSHNPLRLLMIPGDKASQIDDHWMVSAQGKPFVDADPDRVDALLKGLAQIPVTSFAADASTPAELAAWMDSYNLASPDYILFAAMKPCPVRASIFGLSVPLVKDRGPRTYFFGRSVGNEGKRGWFGLENGATTIYGISPKLTSMFSMLPEAWKSKQLLDFSLSQVRTLSLQYAKALLKMEYDYLGETWKGTLAGEDVTNRINPHRANYYLKALQKLQASTWLPEGDEDALRALAHPVFTVELQLEIPDYSDTEAVVIDHEQDGLAESDSETDRRLREAALAKRQFVRRTLTIDVAPSSSAGPKGFFYGRIRETGQLFTLPIDRAAMLDGGLLDT